MQAAVWGGTAGAKARPDLLDELFWGGPATRYADAATAPTVDELWNPRSSDPAWA